MTMNEDETPKGMPPELKAMLRKQASEIAMQLIIQLMSGKPGSNPLASARAGDATDVAAFLAEIANTKEETGSDGRPLAYKRSSPSGEVTTTYIELAINLPLEIIGTHESDSSLEVLNTHIDQGGGMADSEGRQAGYYEVVDDHTIFACIGGGLHIRIPLEGLFHVITSPAQHDKLNAARAQFNELNQHPNKS